MTSIHAVVVLLAGLVAGTINTVVGTGSLISFPALLAVGVPPVVANASNTTGLVVGGLSATLGYRRELAGQAPRLRPLVAASLAGGVIGAVLLLVLPAAAFEAVVPVLVLTATGLMAAQPTLARWLRARSDRRAAPARRRMPLLLTVLTGLLGVYGGYFGAGQGVILLALLALGIDDDLQVVNALKNAAVTAANLAAALVFLTVGHLNRAVGHLDWGVVALIGAGAAVGGQLGARIGRRLPSGVLRGLVVALGLVVAAHLAMR
ncbi:sulfite exporter TauE/SafE family protein [Planosporangium sp. 12N6]|uniref:sulfite exporter TauE/SafE family protein n=1 Tax=Planosporangium spinosum TaxID=3402278 RepID=UPI003CEDB1B8